jgi:hypothetical protein
MPTNLSTGTTADILLVAGGGGGGSNMGGGGGAGGTTNTSQYLNFNTYNITVGAGGSGAPAGGSSVRGNNGTDSMIISTSTTATYSVMFQTAQSLTPGTNASFAYTGDFTVEGWIYRLATGDASMIVQGTSPYFGINVNAGTGINVYLNNATANLVVTNRIPAIQTWNHIALVRSSGIVKVYLNGVPSITTASNAATLGFSASNLYIGANNVTGGANQYISNVRITNGTALYTNTFTVSSTPLTPVTNTVLLACSSSTYTKDFSTSSASLIASGSLPGSPFTLLWTPFNSTFTTVGGGGGGSDYVNPTVNIASFGGSGGGVQSSSSLVGLGITGQGNSGVASIGNYYASGGGGATSVGASAATGNAGGTGLASSILGTTYYWGGGGGGSGYSNLSGNGGAGGGGGGAPLNGGSVSGTGGGYGNIQGINPGADAIAGTLGAQTNKAGGNGGTNTGGGGGGGSHINITNAGGTGGSGAVVIRYVGPQRGTGGTVYSYTVGNISYTAHAFFTSAIFTLGPFPLYAQANGGQGGPYGGGGGGASSWYGAIFNDGAVTGTTSATVYYGSFNGTNQYLTTPATAAYNLYQVSFTIEAWVYCTSLSESRVIWALGTNGSATYTQMSIGTDGSIGFQTNSGSWAWTGIYNSTAAAVSVNAWTHVAVVRDYNGGTLKMFANGQQTYTSTTYAEANGSGGTAFIGTYYGALNFFAGNISNFRLVKGVAVYTGNFTMSLSDLSTTQSSGSNIAAITGSQTSLLTLKNATIIDNSTNNVVVTNVNAVTIASTTTNTVSISYPIGSNISWIGQAGGLGANGSASNNAGYQITAGGGGGGVSTTAASGGGGGVDVYGITSSSNYIIFGGSANNPGLGGANFNLGGQPGTGGNGGLYGGGGAGAAVSSVDTNTGNGAGGALLIVYNTTASTYSYPSIMPVLSNSVGAGSNTLLTFSSTTNKLLLTQFDNIVTSYQGLQYETLNTGNLVNYGNVDINVAKTFQSQSIIAGNLQVITYITDHEMMLKNSDPTLPATYNTPGNYQVIQEVTPANDPRLITVRVQNFVTGVTGSDGSPVVSVTAGGQVWF